MKRFVLPLAVVIFLAGAGVYLQRRMASSAGQVALWLPASTILLEDVPNMRRTAERWPATALAEIIDEPEVQAFLDRPLEQLPDRAELDKRLAQIQGIDPAQFFLAVTEWSGEPKMIAGLSYYGNRADLDSLVDELRKQVRAVWPAGKSDIEKYGSGEIETFTSPSFSAALAYRGRWLFIAEDTALLKATLDRYDAKPAQDSLAELPAFKTTMGHLPDAPDNIFFLRPGLLADKAATLMMMLNPTAEMQGMDDLKKIDAVGIALKLDGEVMRDAAYVLKAAPDGGEPPLAMDALKLSSTDTIVAVSDRMEALGNLQMPDPKADPTGILQLLESYVQIFAAQGLGAEQLGQAFGPETGFVLDWPAGSMIPTPLAMVDVRDGRKAHKFMDTLATLPSSAGVSFTHQEAGGISYYSLPQTGIGFFPLQVTLGLTEKCVIGGLSMEAVTQAAKRWKAASPGLAASVSYQKAAALVVAPTMSFTYVDTKAIFERIYGLFRSVASMGFVPHLSDYVDIAKLPSPETISRHLSPMVSSMAVKDGGLLMESAGPVTTMEAAMVTVITLGAAAVPLVEQEIKGQSVTIPGFPGLGTGPSNSTQNPFTMPWVQGGSVILPAPAASSTPSMPAPSTSPSGGTP
jgi:hypothetical protein